MIAIPTQQPNTQPINYSNFTKTEVKEKPINGEKVLINRERREEKLEFIAFLTQYMEDLKAGRPVENLSPSNDPYFLVPENIADIIDGEKYLLSGGRGRVTNPKNIWEGIE
jgi:hypothetical protein